LVLHFWVFVDTDKGATSLIEVFDHHLAETIIGIIHFVVENEGEVESFIDEGYEFIHFVRVDIAEDAFCIEESGNFRI